MNLLRKVIGDLMGQVELKRDRKPRPGRKGLGSLVEQLETRAMLSQVSVGVPIVVPSPSAVGSAAIVNTPAPFFNVHAAVPVGAGDDSEDLDIIESNGQIGVQLVDMAYSRLSAGADRS